jgi:hypothetical protein
MVFYFANDWFHPVQWGCKAATLFRFPSQNFTGRGPPTQALPIELAMRNRGVPLRGGTASRRPWRSLCGHAAPAGVLSAPANATSIVLPPTGTPCSGPPWPPAGAPARQGAVARHPTRPGMTQHHPRNTPDGTPCLACAAFQVAGEQDRVRHRDAASRDSGRRFLGSTVKQQGAQI